MNKKLLAVAVAAALTPFAASAADVTFSGVVRGALYMDNGEALNGDKNDWTVGIDRARLKVDAKQALDGGMSMSAYFRIGNSNKGGNNLSAQQTGVYLSGGFGDVGIQGVGDSGNFGDTLGHMDIFEGDSALNLFKQGNSSPNTFWYSSPDFNGIKVKLAFLTDNNDLRDNGATPKAPQLSDPEVPKKTNMDDINPRITYNAGPIQASVGINQGNSNAMGGEDYSRLNAGASYTMGNIKVGVSYESEDTGTVKQSTVGGSVNADLGTIGVRAAFASRSGDNSLKGSTMAAGIDFKLGKGAKVFAEFCQSNKDAGLNNGEAFSQQQVGMVLGF